MKLSTRSRYGTRLLLDMAQHHDEGPIRLGAIAERQGIPVKYLEQIIIPLKKAGYVKSVRGSKGGHMLARPPAQVTVGEVISILEGGLGFTECTSQPDTCVRSRECLTRFLWKEASDAMLARLNSITFSDLVEMGRVGHFEEDAP